MKIKTNFNIGDYVYPVRRYQKQVYVKCKTCKGDGDVLIHNTSRRISCPDCYGKGGGHEYKTEEWHVIVEDFSKIGKIIVEIINNKKTHYMIESTGIGSGTLWLEDDLFLDSQKAQLECTKRNETKLTN